MIEEIRRFIAAVDLGSFTKAAHALHITQPALSIAIRRLERTMHAELFQHTSRQLQLTEEGKLTYDMGKHLLAVWDKLKNPESRRQFLGKQHYVLGAFDNAALKLAPFFNLLSKDPSLSLEIIIDNSASLRKQLSFGLLDVCICVLPRRLAEPNLSIMHMKTYEETLLPVASTKWKNKRSAQMQFIVYQEGSTTREYIDDFFRQKGMKPMIAAQSTSTSFMKELVLLGQGVAFLPENVVLKEITDKQLFVVSSLGEVKRKIGVYVTEKNNLNTLLAPMETYLK